MRELGTLPDGDAARTLADYLLTLKIETCLDQQPQGWVVWVCDEDRLTQARQEFTEFQRNPADSRFIRASGTAHELRLRELAEDEEYRRRLAEFREQMTEAAPQPRSVTFILILTAIVVTLVTNFGQDSPVQFFWISSDPSTHLTQIVRGEIWRLITPIFVHGNFLHLLFNCLAIHYLAGQIERQQGTPRLLWLVLVFAVVSNLTQFYLGDPHFDQDGFHLWVSRHFGGLSGVAYGLFGYVWMKSRLAPELGLEMSTLNLTIMLVWFVACWTGALGPIANAAHAAGLALGVAFGAMPQIFQTLRKR